MFARETLSGRILIALRFIFETAAAAWDADSNSKKQYPRGVPFFGPCQWNMKSSFVILPNGENSFNTVYLRALEIIVKLTDQIWACCQSRQS